MGPLSSGENALADELVPRLQPGMLCLADRGFYSFERFTNASKTGAQLLGGGPTCSYRASSSSRTAPT